MSVIHRAVYRMQKVFWKLARPVTVGVRAIVLDPSQTKVLLVRHTYVDGWYLPGGRVEKGETIEQALRRELREELRMEVGELRLFGVYNNFYEGKNDSIVVMACEGAMDKLQTSWEIGRAEWFELSWLPGDLSPGTSRRFDEWKRGDAPMVEMW